MNTEHQATETLTALTTQIGQRTLELQTIQTKLAEATKAEAAGAARLKDINESIAKIQEGIGKGPPSPVGGMDIATALADEMEKANATHEGRKAFIRDGGPARAQKQIKALDALRMRFSKFV
jgi:hypothetical protein